MTPVIHGKLELKFPMRYDEQWHQYFVLDIAMNILTNAELKRRGLAAIEDGLRHGPVHIVKRNLPAAVVLSEDEYERLVCGKVVSYPGWTKSEVAWPDWRSLKAL